jgi:hypothetical protein
MDTPYLILVTLLGMYLIFLVVTTLIMPAIGGNSAVTLARAATTMKTYGKVTSLNPVGVTDKDNTKLCDYYIASSAYSVFPSTYTYDYISDGVLALVIKAGARLVELDIYAGSDDKPIVGLKNESIGYDYAKNTVSFQKCLRAIANTAFNAVETSLSSDPFILSLVFHTDKTHVIDAVATEIKDALGAHLLPPQYAHARQNLPQTNMSEFMGKIIIVSGGNIKSNKFDELMNLSWNSSYLRRLTYTQASQPYDHEELVNSNKKNICMVVPDPTPDLKNNNPTILFGYGCQWNLMNYGSLDDMMELYVEEFQTGSVVLKPDALRFKPVEAKRPVLPDPSVSFQPMAHTSPIYDSNPVTGDKSIVI